VDDSADRREAALVALLLLVVGAFIGWVLLGPR
jgi:hypothetical protein